MQFYSGIVRQALHCILASLVRDVGVALKDVAIDVANPLTNNRLRRPSCQRMRNERMTKCVQVADEFQPLQNSLKELK